MSDQETPVWLEIVCRVADSRQEEALARLAALGWEECWVGQPFEHRPGSDSWQRAPRDPGQILIHCYVLKAEGTDAAAIVNSLREQLGDLVTEVWAAEIEARDWLSSWRESREPVLLTDGWFVTPPWLAETLPAGAKVAVIDPGLAFGTGDHTTTRDSANLLLEWVKPGDRVLDLGAGSGILSILACLAGAESATAVELDPLAGREIRRNATLNEVAAITVIVGDASVVDLGGPYDLVAMNIGARPALMLRWRCERVCAAGARLVVSGLPDWAADGVESEYEANGWRLAARRLGEGDWVTLGLVLQGAAGEAGLGR